MAGVLWGLIGLFTRALSNMSFSALEITFLRALVTASGLALLMLKNPQLFRLRLKDLWMFLGSGLLSITMFNICYFRSIEMNGLSVAVVLLYTSGFFVLLFSALLFKEKVTWFKALALVLAMLGCAMAVGVFEQSKHLHWLGILLGLGSGLGYGLYTIFGKYALAKYDVRTLIFYTFMITAIFLMPFAQISRLVETATKPHVVVLILGLGVLSTILPFLLYSNGLLYTSAGIASLLAYIEPITATLVGVFIFKEKLGLSGILGVILMFAAVALLQLKTLGIKKTGSSFDDPTAV